MHRIFAITILSSLRLVIQLFLTFNMHGGLEPRNRGCEGRGFVIYVCLETLVRKRSLAKVREGESVRGFVCKHGRRQRHHEQLMLGR